MGTEAMEVMVAAAAAVAVIVRCINIVAAVERPGPVAMEAVAVQVV